MMKTKTFGLVLAVSLAIGAVAATPASAGKKAKPVPVKLYLHGNEVVGESESFTLVADAYLPMDATEPSGSEPKSKFITNYVVGPNANCAGNNLFPVWTGELSGTVKGDIKVTLHTAGTPGPIEIRVWPDVNASMCDSPNPAAPADDYPEPAGAVTVDLPPGHGEVEAVIEGVNFKASSLLTFQVSPVILVDIPDPGGSLLTPFVSRILYDTPDLASSIEFSCIPTSGKSC